MRVGAIAFFAEEAHFHNTLKGMGIEIDSFSLTDGQFYAKHGVVKQAPLLMLLTLDSCWGYVAKEVKKRDGSKAWRIVNSKDNFVVVLEDDIYCCLNLDDYTFEFWDEMESPYQIIRSKGNSPIRKSPSANDRNKCQKKGFKIFQNGALLYQLVESSDPYYSKNHPFNTQWDKYSPYFQTPQDFSSHYKSMTNPYPSYNSKTTLHAIPFLRSNIKPTKLSIHIQPKEPVPIPSIFLNFPQGIGIKIV